MTSQSRQKTAFQRGRTPASRWFLFPANIYTYLVAEMCAATFNKNTALFSMCNLSEFSVPEPTLAAGTISRKDNWAAWRIPRCDIVGDKSRLHSLTRRPGVVSAARQNPPQDGLACGAYWLGPNASQQPLRRSAQRLG